MKTSRLDLEAHLSPTLISADGDCQGAPPSRVEVRGKFLFLGNRKLYVRGVTYGTFKPDAEGHEYPDPATVARDFAQMAANRINSVRTYTVPPRWLLDLAKENGLHVMLGLGGERYVGYLTDKRGAPDVVARIGRSIRECAGHPAILCYSVANEIPASTVRWLGARRVQGFLRDLYKAVKREDPGGLVTYVNYPSTEYLHLPFLDFVCFNVYLESKERFEAYLARLQNAADERPLLMAEIGLDSVRNGEEKQAEVLAWQIASTFSAGSAGAFVYAWTDEWFRGGAEVDDWAFGLTTRNRAPKPALAAVRRAFARTPFAAELEWPFISVVVCTYNGSRTIRQTLDGLRTLEYQNYEVLIVDDGSTDSTPDILAKGGFRVIRTDNNGLSAARNVGLFAARGEIVAYTDDDAYPDPHWLTYLAISYMTTNHAGVGGPNIPPPHDGFIADCVANAPGGAAHVLISDTEAEHIPGCNCSFRRDALLAVGGFDPQFRIAGDDVDLCWRIQRNGGTLGFNPAAVVWHHRRNAVKAYWRQQSNYGRAEALLERKWPEKYNASGHVAWNGRIYSNGLARALAGPGRIYHGIWGSAPFQLLYEPEPGSWRAIVSMPEWYGVIALLAALCAVGALWQPLRFAAIPLAVAVGISLFQAVSGALRSRIATGHSSVARRFMIRAFSAYLHLIQPVARLRGRLGYGLSPWRWCPSIKAVGPLPRKWSVWTEQWRDPMERLRSIERRLLRSRAFVTSGGAYDRWDLQAHGGILGGARLLMAVEEHGGGRQLVRFRTRPVFAVSGLVSIAVLGALGLAAGFHHSIAAASLLMGGALLVAYRAISECTGSLAAVVTATRDRETQLE